jgi:hypothetical protein
MAKIHVRVDEEFHNFTETEFTAVFTTAGQ